MAAFMASAISKVVKFFSSLSLPSSFWYTVGFSYFFN